jgi:predicted  nucleic acid-binding Zn-ribbon protein
MSLVEDIYSAFKKIVSVEDRLVRLTDDLKRLQMDVADHGERLARLEGKFELLEGTIVARRRRLKS